jgi:hypothetical protein
MSIGASLTENYLLNGSTLNSVFRHVDLGITITNNLNFSLHCANIAATGHRKAYLLRKCFRFSPANVLVNAFKVYVRPVLEYCSEIWNPFQKKDIRKLESVQRKFTKYLTGCHGLTYAQRLKKI